MPSRPALLRILGNESRLRLILALARSRIPDLTVYKLIRLTGLERKSIKKHMESLIKAGFVEKRSYGPIAVYNLNKAHVYVRKLIDLFSEARLLSDAPSLYFERDTSPLRRMIETWRAQTPELHSGYERA